MATYSVTYKIKDTGKQETATVEAPTVGMACCRVMAKHGTAVTIQNTKGHNG